MGKLTAEERKQFFLEKLQEQRHVLDKSVKDLAAGDLAEGPRVATIIRVLVHESGSSKPLLKQLNKSFLELPILDEAPVQRTEAPPGLKSAVVLSVPIGVRITSEGVFLNPKLDPKTHALTPLGRWWLRDSLIVPGIGGLNRKEVILGLANKEGGTHVDPDMTDKYRQLLASGSYRIGWGDRPTEPLNLSRMMAGQAGVEILELLDRCFTFEAHS